MISRKIFGLIAGLAAVAVGGYLLVQTPAARAETNTFTDGGGYADAGSHGLSRQAMTATSAPADFPVAGIDISSHDHSQFAVDFTSIAASGTKFVYIKATEGKTYANPYYSSDYQAAKTAGLMVGAYAFARPDQSDPVGQADYLVNNSLWEADNQTMIPFIDLEWPYSSLGLGSCWNQTPAQLTTWIHAFLNEVEAKIGRPPMIYTAANWWNPCTGNDTTFGNYPLDVALYGSTAPTTLPAGWSTYAIWQYAGGDNGIAGDYDKDVYHGDVNGLRTLAGASPATTIRLHAHANGEYVSADHAGASPLIANRGTFDAWETFDEVDLGRGNIALRSHADGDYVTADNAGSSPLIANRLSAGAWETFQLVHNTDGSVSLKAGANGDYVTADKGGASPLIASRTSIGLWEEFDEVLAPTRPVSFRAHANGQYVTANNAGKLPLVAARTGIGQWETFDLTDLGGGYLALHAQADSDYVTADNGGNAPLIANRPSAGVWETFQLVHNDDGSVSLKAGANGEYVTADNAGSSPLVASRTAIGPWEEFDLIAD